MQVPQMLKGLSAAHCELVGEQGRKRRTLCIEGSYSAFRTESGISAIDNIAVVAKLREYTAMKVIGRWVICAALAGMAGCAHDGGRNTLKGLERLGRLAEGQRVTVDVYLLDLGSDGLAAGFPAAGGNTDPKRPIPVANGCPTEDLANLLLRFRDPTPETTSIDGRRATVSGVYHAQQTFLDRPSVNAMVYYAASLDDVKIESLHADSCAKWKHSGE